MADSVRHEPENRKTNEFGARGAAASSLGFSSQHVFKGADQQNKRIES
jgi:hypothetical protein